MSFYILGAFGCILEVLSAAVMLVFVFDIDLYVGKPACFFLAWVNSKTNWNVESKAEEKFEKFS